MKKALSIIILCLFIVGPAWGFQASATEYFCPKCQSTNIEFKCVDPVPGPVMKSMDEIKKDSTGIFSVFAVMVYSHMKATCRECGYTVKYSVPY